MQGSRQQAVHGKQGLYRVALGDRDRGSTGRSTQRAQEVEGVHWKQKRWQVGLGTGQSEGHTRWLTTAAEEGVSAYFKEEDPGTQPMELRHWR